MNFRQKVKRFFEPIAFVKQYYIGTLCMVATRPIYGIVTTLAFSWLVNSIQTIQKEQFIYILIGYNCFAVFYQIWNYSRSFSAQKLVWSLYQYLDVTYFKKYITIDNNKSEVLGTGKMLSIIDKGIDQWIDLIIQTTWMGLSAIVNIIFAIYIATTVTRYWGIIMILMIVLMIYIVIILAYKGQYWREKRTDAIDERSRHNVKILMSKHEILVNKKIDEENKKLYDQIEVVKEFDLRKHKYEHIGFNVPTLGLAIISICLFSLLGYKFFYNNSISYAEIVLYLGLVNGLDKGTRDAINLYKAYIKNFVRIEKLWNTFDELPQIIGYNLPSLFQHDTGAICFKNVSFMYDKGKIIDNLSFSISGGKRIALVGKSGGGKTTIMKLIAGFLHADGGSISIDHQQLPTPYNLDFAVSLESYYNHIGYLTQEPNVFDGTIYENLIYALDYVPTEQQINDAIHQSQCNFIEYFPLGLYTEIGEKGVRLSGGQRQRLAIAKIFLKNPSIILLDEPTSALDSLSEELITESLDKLFLGRTVIIIAHRLQTVKKADEILVIEDGTIVERGNHNELVKKNGKYKKMLDLQSGF